MEISDGWGTAYARRKFSLTVDENDLAGLLVDVGLDPGMHIQAGVKFKILRHHAAALTLGELVGYLATRAGGEDEEDPAPFIKEREAAMTARNALLTELWENSRPNDD